MLKTFFIFVIAAIVMAVLETIVIACGFNEAMVLIDLINSFLQMAYSIFLLVCVCKLIIFIIMLPITIYRKLRGTKAGA